LLEISTTATTIATTAASAKIVEFQFPKKRQEKNSLSSIVMQSFREGKYPSSVT